MHNDVQAMFSNLLMRGVKPEEIIALEGRLDRRTLLSFLGGISHTIVDWKAGELFIYVSGHGFFTGETGESARVGLLLQENSFESVYWDEVFQTLSIPSTVRTILLPDH